MLPSELKIDIAKSLMVDDSHAVEPITFRTGINHLFLNLEGESLVKWTLKPSTLTLAPFHILTWGPEDIAEIRPPHKKKYIHVAFSLTFNGKEVDINSCLSQNNSDDPRLYINHETELISEFLQLPNARLHGAYHKDLCELRLHKIIAILGQYFWDAHDMEFQEIFQKTYLRMPNTSINNPMLMDEKRAFRKAMIFFNQNYKNCSTTNLAEFLGLSKPKVISIVKKISGKLPKDIAKEIRYKKAVNLLSGYAIKDIQNNFERCPAKMISDTANYLNLSEDTINNVFKSETGNTAYGFYLERKAQIARHQRAPR